MQQVVIAVLRLQGRKRRWSRGARLVEEARGHRPGDPPPRLRKRVHLSTDEALGFAVHRLAPLVASPGSPTVLYLHGGGYIHDFASQHWAYMVTIVERTGATVLAAQYPLAPDHTWRDSFPQVLTLARSVDVVAGDSAGGGFALAISQSLAAEGIARDTVLIAPFVDATMSDPRTAEYDGTDPWLATDGLLHCGRAWAGEDDPARPEISPLFGDFDGLGRMLVFTGTRDVLHPQARRLATATDTVEVVVEEGCVHNYPLLPIPEARVALEILAGFLLPEDDSLRKTPDID